MKKIEYAWFIVESPLWDGIKDADWLARSYSKQELKDLYNQLLDLEGQRGADNGKITYQVNRCNDRFCTICSGTVDAA